jgi:serine/threonine-protein kinase HipA
MPKILNVFLHRNLVGQLLLDEGHMVFEYADSWLKNTQAVPLSHSLPLRAERFDRKVCRGYFAGILPEESKRHMLAKNLGISSTNDFTMIERIGGECAGAVTFLPYSQKLPEFDYHYRSLSNDELLDILKLLPRQPLMAGVDGVRLSLAGAQDKIAVHVAQGKVSIPLGGAPSTHILKPSIEGFEGMVFNEAYCMKLAAIVGLYVAKVEAFNVGGIDYLLVERYDRHIDGDGTVHRLHQEDFCQALGVASEEKYQSEGGPNLKNCFALLREASSRPAIDIMRLLDAIIFNVLIGNHDAHGKNFSLLYLPGNTQIAPLYDLVSTSYYPQLTKKMAMKIGKEAESLKITLRHFEQLAQDVGLSVPIMKKRLPELTKLVLANTSSVSFEHPVAQKLAESVESRCQLFLERFK